MEGIMDADMPTKKRVICMLMFDVFDYRFKQIACEKKAPETVLFPSERGGLVQRF
jgi:hypothetical protein